MSKRRGLTPLIIGGVVLVVAIVVAVLGLIQVGKAGPGTAMTPGQMSAGAGMSGSGAASAPAAVQEYFDALAAADPDVILSLVRDRPPDRTFLTKEVLAAAVRANPATDVRVTELSSSTSGGEVEAVYRIDGHTQIEKFYVAARAGRWYPSRIAAELYVNGLNPAGTGLTVNGVRVRDVDAIAVFPGGYTLGSTGDTYTFTQTAVVVEGVTSSTDMRRIGVQLSDGALQSFRAATRSLVESCTKPGGLTNARCGMRLTVRPGVRIKTGTIACEPAGTNSIDRMPTTVHPNDLTVRGALHITFACSMQSTSGTRYTRTQALSAVYGQHSGGGWQVTGERP